MESAARLRFLQFEHGREPGQPAAAEGSGAPQAGCVPGAAAAAGAALVTRIASRVFDGRQ